MIDECHFCESVTPSLTESRSIKIDQNVQLESQNDHQVSFTKSIVPFSLDSFVADGNDYRLGADRFFKCQVIFPLKLFL